MFTHLVMYEGGGYSGCIWEWNAFLCRIEKKKITAFKSVIHSGVLGIDNIDKANRHFIGTEKDDNKWDLIKLSSKKQIRNWQDTYNAGLVVGIVSKVAQMEVPGIDLFFHCDDCGCEVYGNGAADGWEGAGGIAMQATEKYCTECYLNHSCDYCGEFWSNVEDAKFDRDGDQRCDTCRE